MALALALTGLGGLEPSAHGTGASGVDPSCYRERRAFPGAHWAELQRGQRLGLYDAIMTCESAAVLVRSTHTFSSLLTWEETEGLFWTTIPESTTVALVPDSGAGLDLEVMEVQGLTFYSTDRDVIRSSRTRSSQISSGSSRLDEFRKETLAELAAMDWEPLTVNQELGPWDVIWTRESGRVEIELVETGPETYHDASTTVLDSTGRETHRRRFRSHMVLIMNPRFYVKARVNKIIGEVSIAKDRNQVREFVWKHPGISAFFGPLDAQEHVRWMESLGKEELQ